MKIEKTLTRQRPSIPHAEFVLIAKIAKRAVSLAFEAGWILDYMDIVMDLEACHTGCHLDLDKLLAADDLNFAHDVIGIRKHLNRQQGTLNNCFLPRCVKESKNGR